MPLLPLLLSNWQLIAKGIGIAIIAFAGYWYFIHNPKVIDGLEKDKAELARIIEAKDKEITLYKDIEQGKAVINESVFRQISTLRATARPRRTVIIKSGSVLPPLPKTNSAN